MVSLVRQVRCKLGQASAWYVWSGKCVVSLVRQVRGKFGHASAW